MKGELIMKKENTMVPEIANEKANTPVEAADATSEAVVEAPSDAPVEEGAPVENRCPNCQALIEKGLSFCPECGTPLKNFCKNCGEELSDGQSFCPKCGHKVEPAEESTDAIKRFNAEVVSQQKKKKKLPLIIAGVVIVIVLATLFSGGGTDFNELFSDIAHEEWCTIASDGSYMEIDSNPDDIDNDSSRFDYSIMLEASSAVERINTELGFSDSVYKKMTETRSLDGRLTEENDNYKVSWTYHPDSGLEVLYEIK